MFIQHGHRDIIEADAREGVVQKACLGNSDVLSQRVPCSYIARH
jgi:hypothetical protein